MKVQSTNIVLTCPICGKQFKYTDACKQRLGKEYVCTWKCFLNYVRKHSPNETDGVRRRGRPRKVSVNDK